jgi:excisionase family DNA binding protein
MTELLTTKEIAQFLRLRPETVLRKVRQGEIPAIKVGGRFRFDKEQIAEWLRHNSTSTKSVPVNDNEEATRQPLQETLEDSGYHPRVPQPVTC